MILRSIQVEGWRCFAQSVQVGPFAEGLNVIHAPNAAGKSSLLEALVRGLFDGHRVTGRDVDALRSWGRTLVPAVTLEFQQAGTEYRLSKRFLDEPSSRLHRKEAGKFIPLAEGEGADEKVRKILAASQPARGLSKPAHWGLAQVLCVQQGELAFEKLSGDLVAGIHESLGVQIAGPKAGPLEAKIEDLHSRFFTRGGKLRSGKEAPPALAMEERLAELSGKRQALLQGMEDLEAASRKVEDLGALRIQAKRDAESLEKELRETRSRASSYAALIEQRKAWEAQAKSAQARHAALRQQIEAIGKARQEIAQAAAEVARLQSDAPAHAREVETLESQSEKARARLEEIRKERGNVDKAWREVEFAQRFVQARDRLAAAQELLEKLTAAEEGLKNRRRQVVEIVAPDAETLRAIRKSVKARDDAQVRLDAALITLEIVPQKAMVLEILSAEETGEKDVSPGKPIEVKGAPEVVVDLKGLARIRARGPTGSVKELREEVEKAVRKIEKLTREFGTAQIEELEQRYEKASGLNKEIAEVTGRLETLLGKRSVEEIDEDRAKAARSVEELLGSHPAWHAGHPDVEALKAEARSMDRSFVSRVEEVEGERDALQKALAKAVSRSASLQSELTGAERAVKSIAGRIAELEKDGRDDGGREAEAAKLALEWDAARASLSEVEERLKAYADDPRSVVEKMEKNLEALRQMATEALEKQKKEEGKLTQLASEGPYSALARTEEEIASLEKEVAAERLSLDAIRLLYETVTASKSEMLSAVARPVEEVASRILQRIAGSRMGSVRLGDSFCLEGIVPKVLEGEKKDPVEEQELSGGEKEQVHLAVRLALADVLAREERQLLVLDDVLTATDTGRLARILSILDEFGQRLQMLILTCHPERYRGLVDARFFDLEDLAAQC